jgi:hypothetical protein
MRRPEEGQALIGFLNTLTGDNAKELKAQTRPSPSTKRFPETDPASRYKPSAHTSSTEAKVGLQPTARVFL